MNLPAVILIMCYANAWFVHNVKRMQKLCVYHYVLDFHRHNTNEKLHFRFSLRNLYVILCLKQCFVWLFLKIVIYKPLNRAVEYGGWWS